MNNIRGNSIGFLDVIPIVPFSLINLIQTILPLYLFKIFRHIVRPHRLITAKIIWLEWNR